MQNQIFLSQFKSMNCPDDKIHLSYTITLCLSNIVPNNTVGWFSYSKWPYPGFISSQILCTLTYVWILSWIPVQLVLLYILVYTPTSCIVWSLNVFLWKMHNRIYFHSNLFSWNAFHLSNIKTYLKNTLLVSTIYE